MTNVDVFRDLGSYGVLKIIGVIIGTWLLLKLNHYIFQSISKKSSADRRYRIMSFQPIIRLFLIFNGIYWVFDILIVPNASNVLTILGAAGLAIGFAFREYISSLIAGIVTLYEGPYRPGDWIEIDGVYGEVISIGMRSVKILTSDDVLVHMPFIKVWQNSIHNYNYGSTNLMTVTNVFVRPNQDLDTQEIKDTLYNVVLASPYTRLDKPISVSMSMEIHGLKYRIKSYPIDPRDQFKYKTDLSIRADKTLRKLNIELSEFH